MTHNLLYVVYTDGFDHHDLGEEDAAGKLTTDMIANGFRIFVLWYNNTVNGVPAVDEKDKAAMKKLAKEDRNIIEFKKDDLDGTIEKFRSALCGLIAPQCEAKPDGEMDKKCMRNMKPFDGTGCWTEEA